MMHVAVRNIKPARAGREVPEGWNLTTEKHPESCVTVLCSDEPWSVEGDCRSAWLGYYANSRDGWTAADEESIDAPLYWKAI